MDAKKTDWKKLLLAGIASFIFIVLWNIIAIALWHYIYLKIYYFFSYPSTTALIVKALFFSILNICGGIIFYSIIKIKKLFKFESMPPIASKILSYAILVFLIASIFFYFKIYQKVLDYEECEQRIRYDGKVHILETCTFAVDLTTLSDDEYYATRISALAFFMLSIFIARKVLKW